MNDSESTPKILTPKDILSAEDYYIYQRRERYGESYGKIAEAVYHDKNKRQNVLNAINRIKVKLKQSGIEWDSDSRKNRKKAELHSREFLQAELVRFYEENGRRATTYDLSKGNNGFPSLRTYNQVFSNLRDAYKGIEDKIPVEPKPHTPSATRLFTPEDLLEAAKRVSAYLKASDELEFLPIPELRDMKAFKVRTENLRERAEKRLAKLVEGGKAYERVASEMPPMFPNVATYYKNYPGGWPGLVADLQKEGYIQRGGGVRRYRTQSSTYEMESLYEMIYQQMLRTARIAANDERVRLKGQPGVNLDLITWEKYVEWPSFAEAERWKMHPSAYTMRKLSKDNHWANFIAEAKKYVLEKYGQTFDDRRRL